jgi:hypothetical protein
MKKTNRRTANKEKLKSLEWSDKAIEDFCDSANVKTGIVDVPPENADNVDDMEAKIARVQTRKKEAESRDLRKKATTVEHKSNEFPEKSYKKVSNDRELPESFNSFFDRVLADNSALASPHTTSIPLSKYDSSLYNEKLPLQINWPKPAVCLIPLYDFDEQPSLRERGLGAWFHCEVLEYKPASDKFKVQLSEATGSQVHILTRMQVYFSDQNPEFYLERILDALKRRYECISLLKYEAYFNSMPFNELVTSTMESQMCDRIYIRAASNKRLLKLNIDVANMEIQEAKVDFEVAMNKILFDANILSQSNSAFMRSLNFPDRIFQNSVSVQYSGLVEIPKHHMKTKVAHHKSSSYISSNAAVSALQGILNENNQLHGLNIVTIDYNKTFTLEKFERYMSEQMMAAVRTIKQEWPQRSGLFLNFN